MKYCFIINPAAGNGDPKEKLVGDIERECRDRGLDYEVYFTTGYGDATKYVKALDDRYPEGEIALYACGGDGTLGETVNGIMGLKNKNRAMLGVIPTGTGNDFVRQFTDNFNFKNIVAQIKGESMDIDIIKCNDKYAVNMLNIGFDCEVVCKKEALQRHKWIPSKLAYIIGLVMTLIRKPGVKCRVSCDGGESVYRDMLLTTFGNGEFCGGGFHSNPESRINNGKINALFVNNVSRTKFVSIVGSYKKGTHLVYTDVLDSHLVDSVKLEFEAPANVSVDGEVIGFDKEILISAVKNAVRFIVPAGSKYIRKGERAGASAAVGV